MNKKITVVGALIYENGKILICQRPKDKSCALLWEFVGGKVENGESKEQALKRECYEELKIEIEVGKEFCKVVHDYPTVTVDLTVFMAKIIGGVVTKIEHNAVKWVKKEELDCYEFCPADVEILRLIKNTL